MFNIFCSQRDSDKKEEAKTFILREFFNSASQKRAVVQAARESAEDQRELLDKYNKLVKQ